VSEGEVVYLERIFLAYIEGAEEKYICVASWDEQKFDNWKEFDIIWWKYCKKIEKEEPVESTLDGKIATIEGIDYTLSLVN
jgi:hypothetical protein